jgi:transcriptional regulator with XRE-family HTH domain
MAESMRILRRAREVARFTLADVGHESGLAPSTVFLFEEQRRRPSPEAAARWHGAVTRLLATRQVAISEALRELLGEAR